MVHFSDLPNNTNKTWYKDPGLRMGMFHIFILYTCVYSLGYDGSLLNGLQALPEWQNSFGYPKGTQLGLIAASYYLPKIPAVFAIAWAMDKYGRKPCLYVGSILMIAGAAVGASAPNVGAYIGSRVILGVGTATGQLAATALVPELSHPRIRHFAGSYLLTCFYIGSIFSSWLTFAMVYIGPTTWSWRAPNLVQGFGPALLGLGALLLPESPRWLIKNGKSEQAHGILAKYHANGDLQDPLVLFELQEIHSAIEVEKLQNAASYRSFITNAANRRRLITLLLVGTCTQLSGNGVVQYYLVPILRTVGIETPAQTAGINGGLAIFNWICALFGASLVERFGRRPLFLFSLAGQLFAFILLTSFSGAYASNKIQAFGIATVPFIFMQQGVYSVALTPLPLLFIPEIMPLSLRAKALGIYAFSQNVSQTFNQFVNPVALAAIAWKYYFVYIGILIFYLVTFFYMIRETKGLTVEEAAVIYENEDSKEAALEAERAIARQLEGVQDMQIAKEIKEEDEHLEKVDLERDSKGAR